MQLVNNNFPTQISMKYATKTILGLFLLSLIFTTTSCKKKEKELRTYYLNHARDSDLIGKFELDFVDSVNGVEHRYMEYTSDGKRLNTGVINGKTYNNGFEYWYTEGATIHLLTYKPSLLEGSYEMKENYYLSSNKDSLFAGERVWLRQ